MRSMLQELGLHVALAGSVLMAGVFFAFSSFIMPGLAKLTPSEGIRAMQGINAGATSSPLFLAVFVGTAIVSVGLTASTMLSGEKTRWVLVGASLAYVLGAFVVTMLFNVPRNEALDKLDPASVTAAADWARYLSEWTAWNHVRTLTSLASSLAFAYASRGIQN